VLREAVAHFRGSAKQADDSRVPREDGVLSGFADDEAGAVDVVGDALGSL